MAKPIPDGFRSLTPYLRCRDAAAAIDFYKAAFGAEELHRLPGPDGKSIMHAELKIGDSIMMLGEECKEWNMPSPTSLGGSGSGLHIYVNDVDKAWDRAVKAGAKVTMPLSNTFWGDRYGKLTDPFGHEWSLATHIEDFPPAEMARRATEAMKQMGKPPQE
jgi:PhnB protein